MLKSRINLEKNYVSPEDKDLLLHFLRDKKNLDFTEYSEASVRRRIAKILSDLSISKITDYIEYLDEDDTAIAEFVDKFTVNVTELFRDPFFYKTLQLKVFPQWENKAEINIWSAGCSSGEEVASLCILLEENNLLHRCKIIATDLSASMIDIANKRITKLKTLKEGEETYKESGGKNKLTDYYTIDQDNGEFKKELYENVTFIKHNLTKESFPNNIDLVVCRNVLIYFNPSLQNKIINGFNNSLNSLGFLSLGSKESIIFYKDRTQLTEITTESKIYQKLD